MSVKTTLGVGAVWEEARKTESIKSFIFRSGTIITNIGQEKKIKKIEVFYEIVDFILHNSTVYVPFYVRSPSN